MMYISWNGKGSSNGCGIYGVGMEKGHLMVVV